MTYDSYIAFQYIVNFHEQLVFVYLTEDYKCRFSIQDLEVIVIDIDI